MLNAQIHNWQILWLLACLFPSFCPSLSFIFVLLFFLLPFLCLLSLYFSSFIHSFRKYWLNLQYSIYYAKTSISPRHLRWKKNKRTTTTITKSLRKPRSVLKGNKQKKKYKRFEEELFSGLKHCMKLGSILRKEEEYVQVLKGQRQGNLPSFLDMTRDLFSSMWVIKFWKLHGSWDTIRLDFMIKIMVNLWGAWVA